jgi:hypothetical protein
MINHRESFFISSEALLHFMWLFIIYQFSQKLAGIEVAHFSKFQDPPLKGGISHPKKLVGLQ